MRLSQLLFRSMREEPGDADVRSHALMTRAGFVQKVAAGIYVYGPLMHRVLRRIEAIVRGELDRAGCQEILMPALQPRDLWDESGRWDRYVTDGILFHFEDRKGSEVCLGPTHEEVVTNYVKGLIQSYKQLPVTLYQIQTKFRDEIRPRFGVMRGREFIMKDAYSFDVDEEGMAASYQVQRGCYQAIFTRCGLEFMAVAADSGAIGGSKSEEFMVTADSGEDAIAICRETGYAANLEAAIGRIPEAAAAPEQVPMHKEATPNARSCDDLCALFPDLPLTRMLKTVLYKGTAANEEQIVAVMMRGDREINEVKLLNYLGAEAVELAGEEDVKKATGAELGFAGPLGLPDTVRLVADESVRGVDGFLCGANETGVHYLDVWFGRDMEMPPTADFSLVAQGDLTADGEGTLEVVRGIEVGHIFQLGTKYSESMGASFAPQQGKPQSIFMGCYGIGISRIAAAAIEQNHDDKGMIWPLPIAPYAVHLVQMRVGDETQDRVAAEIYADLAKRGIDTLWDERKGVSPGAKFKDADLLGVPLRIVVGRDAADGKVEYGQRSGGDNEVIAIADALEHVEKAVAEANVPAL